MITRSQQTIACIADSHFDESDRLEECIRLHTWIADDLLERKPDVILHGGDVFERASTPTERRAAADWIVRMAELAPVVIVRGNHDRLGDLAIFERLRTRHPVIVEERAGVHVVGGVAVAALAWPRKAELLASLPAGIAREDGNAAAAEGLRAILRGFHAELSAHEGPTALVAHAMVRGSITSVGQPLVGHDMEIGTEDLALAAADVVFLGHIHKGQHWTHDDVPIVYPGSPRRTAFGELEDKGYILARVGGERATWERIVAPATRMLLVDAEWTDAGFVVDGDPGTLRDAEVRYRYSVDSDKRDAAKFAAEEYRLRALDSGAVLVKVEEVVRATSRARMPDVAAKATVADKLTAFWGAKGRVPTPERASRLLGRLQLLEEGVADAHR